jgi:arylsulfatase A-like enzyme
MRRLGIALIVWGLFAGSQSKSRAQVAPKPPNIVLILADDLGWGDVSFNGRRQWATPNLDRLAAKGIKFNRCYTAAVVCAPSRAALLTGKYTIHCGVSRNDDDLPASEVTIAEALKARGYNTALFGKWHHGKPREKGAEYVHPMDQGFDEFFGFTDATHAWEKFPNMLWEGRERKPSHGYADDLFTDHAIDFFKRHKDRPFFLYLPYISAHFNIEAPADEIERNRGKVPEPDSAAPLNTTYASQVTRLDREVGRVMAALEEQGLAENTLVFFTSDHGATFEAGNKGTSIALDSNFPFRGQKRTLWEGGVRVPSFVVWSGKIPAGKVSEEIVHLTDLLPTFLAVTGAQPDPAWRVDGMNQLPTWMGEARAPERTLFWEWRSEGSNQIAAMRGRFKLVITNGGRAELFDVITDPAERQNTAAVHQEDVLRLNRELKTWLASERDPTSTAGPAASKR